MAKRLRLAIGFMALTCGAAAGCSSGAPSTGHDSRSDGLTICWLDSGLCWNTPDIDAGGGSFPGFDAGGSFPGFDAGSFPGFDASVPQWPDAGFGSFDASFGYCPWQDPKYATEYNTALSTFSVKPCAFGCAPTECCYANLSCVAQ